MPNKPVEPLTERIEREWKEFLAVTTELVWTIDPPYVLTVGRYPQDLKAVVEGLWCLNAEYSHALDAARRERDAEKAMRQEQAGDYASEVETLLNRIQALERENAELRADRDSQREAKLSFQQSAFELRQENAELRAALLKVRSYNVDIAAGRINYRPEDHIAVIDAAVEAAKEGR
jgi:hypothetical protein